MKRYNLSYMLGVLVTVPLIALMIFGTVLTVQSFSAYRDIGRISSLQTLISATAKLVSLALPGEGFSSVAYLQTGAGQERSAMMDKRRETDLAVDRFRQAVVQSSFVDEGTRSEVDQALKRLHEIDEMRRAIDNGQGTLALTVGTMQGISRDGIDLIGHLAKLSTNDKISSLIIAYYAILNLNDGNAEELGSGVEVFRAGKLDQDHLKELMSANKNQELFARLLRDFGPADVIARFEAFQGSQTAKRIEAMRTQFSAASEAHPLDRAGVGPWIAVASERNAQIREMIVASDENLAVVTNGLLARARLALIAYCGSTLLVIVLVVLLTWGALGSIRHQLRMLVDAMSALASRNYAVAIPGVGRSDQIGVMARALNVFKESMIAGDKISAEREAEQAAKERRSAHLETMVQSFESKASAVVGVLSSAAGHLQTTAASLAGNAAHASEQAARAVDAAQQANGNVEMVAAAAEELAASVREIGRQVVRSTEVAEKAMSGAKRTSGIVRALAEGASRIGEVVNLIGGIANQTNLLALNATIEAARAGEIGRGFSVVASEVKTLAIETAKATGEVAEQVNAIQTTTDDAVKAIQEILLTIGEIDAISTVIAGAVEQQGSASQEIARNIQAAAARTYEVTLNIAGVGDEARETGHGAQDVLTAAQEVSQQAGGLGSEVSVFLSGVRSA